MGRDGKGCGGAGKRGESGNFSPGVKNTYIVKDFKKKRNLKK